jgi:peroxiredoxin
MTHFISGAGQESTSHSPSEGEMMPDFTLVSSEGNFVRISDYRGRRNLVLIFCGDGKSEATRSFLLQVSQQHFQFGDEEAESLAIVQGESLPERLGNLSFPVLLDAKGRAHQLAGIQHADKLSAPLVYLVDRFGEIRYAFHPQETANAAVAAVLEWVRYINLECPE